MDKRRDSQRGFTLVELMVVVAILGILAAIAVPQFTAFVRKSETTDPVLVMGRIDRALKGWAATHSADTATIFGTGNTYALLRDGCAAADNCLNEVLNVSVPSNHQWIYTVARATTSANGAEPASCIWACRDENTDNTCETTGIVIFSSTVGSPTDDAAAEAPWETHVNANSYVNADAVNTYTLTTGPYGACVNS